MIAVSARYSLFQKGALAIRCYSTDLAKRYLPFKELRSQNLSIEDGYGEYVVYSKDPNLEISKDIYDICFKVLENQRISSEKIDRPWKLHKEIQRINPGAEIAFIPRTLYELLYIRASIEEELEDRKICPLQNACFHEVFKEGRWRDPKEKINRCWHLCRYDDKTPLDDQKETLRNLAFRINQLAVHTWKPKTFFTGAQITTFTENEIEFLKNHYRTFLDIFRKQMDNQTFCGSRGAAVNFGLKESLGLGVICTPMGVRNDSDAQIIRNTTALECDKIARNAHVLYRGGDLFKPDCLTSISWGTSLFGGAFLDGTACVFHYATHIGRKVYALVIPQKEASAPFYIPSRHPIRHLFSTGEFHHARSLLPCNTPQNAFVKGIYTRALLPSFIYSKSEVGELQTLIEKYHSQAIPLN